MARPRSSVGAGYGTTSRRFASAPAATLCLDAGRRRRLRRLQGSPALAPATLQIFRRGASAPATARIALCAHRRAPAPAPNLTLRVGAGPDAPSRFAPIVARRRRLLTRIAGAGRRRRPLYKYLDAERRRRLRRPIRRSASAPASARAALRADYRAPAPALAPTTSARALRAHRSAPRRRRAAEAETAAARDALRAPLSRVGSASAGGRRDAPRAPRADSTRLVSWSLPATRGPAPALSWSHFHDRA